MTCGDTQRFIDYKVGKRIEGGKKMYLATDMETTLVERLPFTTPDLFMNVTDGVLCH